MYATFNTKNITLYTSGSIQ